MLHATAHTDIFITFGSHTTSMKKVASLFLILLLASCQLFDKKAPDEDELLEQRLQEIDWNAVSAYPSLPQCDSISDKEAKKECFFSAMSALVQERLNVEPIAALQPDLDTLELTVTVFPDATLLFYSDSTAVNSVKIDSILQSNLADFPKVEPAQKEGVPVKSRFILPVVLRSSHP